MNNSLRSVSEVKTELTITGAKDAFVEDINTNYTLINNRIKSHLRSKTINIGRYSKTSMMILSVEGITSKSLIDNVISRLRMIDIDGIIDSSYLKHSLEDEKNLLPTIMMSERPDKVSMALLEGKVVLLVDNSPYAIILPTFFIDFFHTPDDYYQKSYNTTFIRIIRLISFIIAIFLPGLFIAVTTRNYNLVPLPLLLMLKAGRTFVPFPAYIEALIMIIAFEILRESDIRMSATSASSISILGGLILGDAAVAAGIVSPIMIIIIAISSIAGLIFNSIEFVNSIRIYKIICLLFCTFFGINGLIYCLLILIVNLCHTKVFGYSYLNFRGFEYDDFILKYDKKVRTRNKYLTKNIIRGRYK